MFFVLVDMVVKIEVNPEREFNNLLVWRDERNCDFIRTIPEGITLASLLPAIESIFGPPETDGKYVSYRWKVRPETMSYEEILNIVKDPIGEMINIYLPSVPTEDDNISVWFDDTADISHHFHSNDINTINQVRQVLETEFGQPKEIIGYGTIQWEIRPSRMSYQNIVRLIEETIAA